MRGLRMVFDALYQEQMEHTMGREEKLLSMAPRSSSPVTVYVELPCIIEQAFPTIAWEDFEETAAEMTHGTSSFGDRADDCISGGQDLQDCVLDITADSPCTLESSLSSAEGPFQGCVIPPLTPQPHVYAEDRGPTHADRHISPVQCQDNWKERARLHDCVLGHSAEVQPQIHRDYEEKQTEIPGHVERNHHLKQLASRAKHLAEVLEKLMMVSEPNIREAVSPPQDRPSLSPYKRLKLDEGYETETDSVEDMLRDVSTRCNAVLHGTARTGTTQREADGVSVFGSFSGLKTSFSNCSARTERLSRPEEGGAAFQTSIKEHSTIKTHVFTHGHAFTTRTQQGGYRFRWVPNHKD